MSSPQPKRVCSPHPQFSTHEILIGGVVFLALIPALAILPYHFPTNSDAASAAAVVGYNNRVAYTAAVVLGLIATALFAAGGRFGWFGPSSGNNELAPVGPAGFRWGISGRQAIEIAVVFSAAFFLYCPFFLARYGPYIEDSYALSALHRLYGHQKPYVDFDFAYGPAMYFIPYGWTHLFGYSMTSYYTLIALAEATEFAALAYVVQRFHRDSKKRLFSFGVISAVLFNSLLALSYNGARKLLPVLIIGIFALRPRSRPALISGACLLGFLLTYSHEFAIAVAAALTVMYGLLLWRDRSVADVVRLATSGMIAGVVWLGASYALLGDSFPGYLRATATQIRRYNAGDMAFAFYWTVNSLAVFAFFILVCALAGKALARIRSQEPASGDLFVWGALAYAMVALRSGLQRADMWHLVPPFLALFVAFLLPLPRRLFAVGAVTHRWALALITVVAATYLLALAPTASFFMRGDWLGMRDVLAGVPNATAQPGLTRQPSIEFERSHPDSDVVATAAYLASPERRGNPVFFYGRAWSYDKRLGIVKITYANDDFLLEESWGDRYRHSLEEQPDALIVMETQEFERLFGFADRARNTGPRDYYEGSFMKTLSAWLSTVHYQAIPLELKIKEQRWEQTIGGFVRTRYTVVRQFGFFTILARKDRGQEIHSISGRPVPNLRSPKLGAAAL
jgi:hypothetical protein